MSGNEIPYVVEAMTPADIPEVAALERTVFTLPWSRYAFEHEVQHNPMAHFLILRKRDTGTIMQKCASRPVQKAASNPSSSPALLGYGGFWLIIDEAHICTLAVHPDWRGKGLGELLLMHLIEHASQLNAAVLTLEVRATNLVAQRLYGKYGFRKVGRRSGYYMDTGEDAIIMTTDPISSTKFHGRLQELQTALRRRLAVEPNRVPSSPQSAVDKNVR